MKILITGSNGFVGKSLAEQLGEDNYIIGTGTREVSEGAVNSYFKWDMAKEPCPMGKIPEDIEIIIHAAACLDKDNASEQLVPVNCMGTYRIYQLAKSRRVKKVFYISGAGVIGAPLQHPITEAHPNRPQTMYHATKLAGEMILDQLASDGIENINLRIPSPIGPGMPIKTILPIFVNNALEGKELSLFGRGSRRQNYLDVRDLGDVIRGCMNREGIAGTYLIASRETVSNLELARLCIELTQSTSQIRFAGKEDPLDGQVWDIDCRKAYDKLGYRQNYGIRDSLREIIAWKWEKSSLDFKL